MENYILHKYTVLHIHHTYQGCKSNFLLKTLYKYLYKSDIISLLVTRHRLLDYPWLHLPLMPEFPPTMKMTIYTKNYWFFQWSNVSNEGNILEMSRRILSEENRHSEIDCEHHTWVTLWYWYKIKTDSMEGESINWIQAPKYISLRSVKLGFKLVSVSVMTWVPE